MGQLRLKNQQGKGIDETAEDPLRHKAHLVRQAQVPPGDLQQTGDQSGDHQVLNTKSGASCFPGGHKTCHQQRR